MNVSQAGKLGGSVKSDAKKTAAKINGKFGGRPINAVNLNDDGYSIKGCNYIYAPKGKALEYSDLAANPYRGCGNQCTYCYVPNVIRMKRPDFDSTANDRPNFIKCLNRDAAKYKSINSNKQIMFSFTTDPYHPFDTSLTRESLQSLIDHDLNFCTLTKGGSRALRDIDLFRSNKDSFASTLTSFDDRFSRKFERGAANATDRIETLRKFSESGIFTWVSIEPTLSVSEAKKILTNCNGFVNHFKIGKANYIKMKEEINWEQYTHEIIELCQKLNISHYIKKDLQMYLPENYENNMRIKQHY